MSIQTSAKNVVKEERKTEKFFEERPHVSVRNITTEIKYFIVSNTRRRLHKVVSKSYTSKKPLLVKIIKASSRPDNKMLAKC